MTSIAALAALLVGVSGLATPAMAASAPKCTSAQADMPAVVTVGEVTARTGQRIVYQADLGRIRVGGTDAIDRSLNAETRGATGAGDRPAELPTASMSYVAYFRKEPIGARRPLMFIWDGGPGSSTRPMLMGSFGPIVDTAAAWRSGDHAAPPIALVRPNPDTLLDVADLVFVDAPGTGFGGISGCDAEKDFYGVDVDAAAFRRFIHRFRETFHRTDSPLYLFGLSYGTIRATVLARHLQETGTPVSGVVLLSSMLATDAWSDGARANVGTENAFFLSLPSFAAAAWAHGKVAHRGDLASWLHEVERFSLDDYAPALLQGSDLPADRKRVLADRLSTYTGLSAQTWLNADLRLEASRFRDLLEADQGRIVGREDTRLDGPAPKVKGTAVEDDPTLSAGRAAKRSAFNAYVRGTLGLGDRPFVADIDVPWDMHHVTDPGAWPDTFFNAAPDLVATMKANPRLKVLMMGGYFDLAGPFFNEVYLIRQLELPSSLRSNLTWREYPASHNAYEDVVVRRNMHDRIADLVQ